MSNKIYIGVGLLLVFFILATGVWFLFFRSTAGVTTDTTPSSSSFGGNPVTTSTDVNTSYNNGTQSINTTAAPTKKIFQIAPGPIVGATLIQTLRPTTTIARYIRQDDGHVFDIPLGVAGAVPRTVSNVTIPGGQRVLWLEKGAAAILQYVDGSSIVKTVYLGFPQATTSAVLPTHIQFLPDNIIDIAASPDGKSIAYLIKGSGGADGYIAKSDGTGSKKVFSLPLAQLLISWPSDGTILLQTKSAVGVIGMAFTADIKTGGVSALFSAGGLSATTNNTFASVVYQKNNTGDLVPTTYARDMKTGLNTELSFGPYPEKCIWSTKVNTILFCAAPTAAVPTNYIDLWRQGAADYPDTIFTYNITNGINSALATPGSNDGGSQSDIAEMALSPNETYLSFVTKRDRSLWGVLVSK